MARWELLGLQAAPLVALLVFLVKTDMHEEDGPVKSQNRVQSYLAESLCSAAAVTWVLDRDQPRVARSFLDQL